MRRLAFAVLPAIALLIAACGGDSSEKKSALESLPADTSFVLTARVADGLGDSDIDEAFGSFSADTTGAFGSLEEALASAREESGFDFAEIDEFVVAFGGGLINPDGVTAPGETGLYMFAEGVLDRTAVIAALEAEEGPLTTTTYKGHEVIENEAGGVVFLRDDLLVLGAGPALRAVIDVREGDADPLSGRLLDTLDSLGEPLAKGVLTLPEGLLEQALADVDLGALPFDFSAVLGFDTLGFSLAKVEGDFSIRTVLGYASDEEATTGAELLQSVVGLLSAFSGDASISTLLEKVTISGDGNDVLIDFQFNVDELEELADGAEALGETFGALGAS